MSRLAPALPLGAVALALGLVAGLWAGAAALALLALGLALLGPRLSAGLIGEVLLGAASLGAGALLLSLLPGPPAEERALHPFWSGVAGAALLASATRQLLRAPLGGPFPGWALALLALIACGAAHGGAGYAAPAYLFLLLSLVQLRLRDPQRRPLPELPPRSRALAALLPLLGAALAALAVAPLRPLQRFVQERFDLAYGDEAQRAGFGDRFALGSLDRLLSSDEVVLRLRGPQVDYLRGLVYDRYEAGRWTTVGGGRPARLAVGKGEPPGPHVEIRAAGDSDRLFLPLDLAALHTASGAAVAVAHGALRRVPADEGQPLWLVPGPRRVQPLSPPTEEDLRLPAPLQAPLRQLARDLAGDAADSDDSEARLRRLEERLRSDYRYSLQFRRAPGVDPVLDFLTRGKEGHCEYFASALALLGRALGVATRVVGGYRVVERNPLSGDHVVRERDAHAWVEAYVPGRGWRSYDATPAATRPDGSAQGMGTAVLDLAAARLGRALRWLRDRPASQVAPAAIAVAAVLALVLLILRLRGRRGLAAAPQVLAFSPPPAAFLRLEAALAARGHRRPPSEPLERYAARLPEPRAAALLLRYAALRYGGAGDAAAMEREMAACAAELEGPR